MRIFGVEVTAYSPTTEEEMEEIGEDMQQMEYEDVLNVAYAMSDEDAQDTSHNEHRHWRGKK